MLVCWFFLDSQGRYLLQIVSICGWGGGVGALVFYQKGREWKRIPVIFGAILGIWLLVPAWLAIIDLLGQPQKGPGWVLLLMVIVWGADSGAYFVGKRFGRHLLASRLSPAKTLEGLLGGMLSAILLAYAGFMVLGEQAQFFPRGLILALFVSLFSVVGDLFESMMKRIAGVKDSGNLLPGHGGVLDRIDSLTAAAPAFWLGVVFVQGTGV
jgi:phosphatidate cytidylyltransferase